MPTVNITLNIDADATSGHANNKLRSRFGDDRGDVLQRLAQASGGSANSKAVDRILAAVADAINAAE